jgi:signal transduction histidine kinase
VTDQSANVEIETAVAASGPRVGVGRSTLAMVLRFALLGLGFAVGACSLVLAQRGSEYSFAASSAYAAAAELIAGYALLAVGLIATARPRQWRLGVILVAAAIAWFLPEWNNPATGSSFVFSVGLVLYLAAAPLAAHAVLAYPDGRLRTWPDRFGVAFAYGGAVLLLGVISASVFDPVAAGCLQCPSNLLLVDGNSGVYNDINRVGVHLGAVWSLLLIVLIVAGLVRSTSTRRRLAAPVAAAGCAYLGLVAADFFHSWGRGFLSNDPLDRRLWLAQAAALFLLAVALAGDWLRARRARSQVARLVLQMAESPNPGGLRDLLAATLHDSSLELGYPLDEDRVVDARGGPIRLAGEITPLILGGVEMARLSHRSGLLEDPSLAEEVIKAARLALQNERLQAEVRAQLEDLRASRSRIVEASDTERRRLERDLHDGAQQRLVGLALSLRLARSRLGPDPAPALLQRIEDADAELRAALAELRELARGIFPAVLDEEGLAAAVETLAEDTETPFEIGQLPEGRLDPAVEAAAYFVIAGVARRTGSTSLTVSAARAGDRLLVEVTSDGAPADIVELEDRVGALDGTLRVSREPSGGVRIQAEIPCVS